MNDRLKFRVWDKYTRTTPAENMSFLTLGGYLVDSDGCHYSPDDYIVEQCTGLKDKNGKLIYEGDIIRINDDFHTDDDVLIVWKNYAFRCEDVAADGYYNLLCELLPEHIEIIGNIHEQKDAA